MTPGKIILSGEYAVVFGYPGIAVPATTGIHATKNDTMRWTGIPANKRWIAYLRSIIDLCVKHGALKTGISIENALPLGKGMGASTALVIAVVRCLFHNSPLPFKPIALSIENTLNPGHSGLDFEVIWKECPILFRKGKPSKPISVPINQLIDTPHEFSLIDTGKPDQITSELVVWIRARQHKPAITTALQTIGHCTERLLSGESPLTVFPDHHRAQVALGVVPKNVQKLIADIEKSGGAAKVIGAGSRSGGGGIVLALAKNAATLAAVYGYNLLHTQHRIHQVLGQQK